MSFQLRPDRSRSVPLECAYCRYSIPGDPVETDDGYFCSATCLEAARTDGGDGDDANGSERETGSGTGTQTDTEDEPERTESQTDSMRDPGAYKRIVTGVEPLDALVPDGVPADSVLLLSGQAGTRRSELLTELAWRALERGEPAVVLTATTPPTAVLERFFENGWNVLPALEDDRLRIVDCFTHRLSDPEALAGHSEWLEFVGEAAADAIVPVEEPDDPGAIRTALTDALEALEMTETGLVTIDSLDALEGRLGTDAFRELCLELRATISKARYVPIIAGATPTTVESGLESFAVDGIVDLRLVEYRDSEMRHRQLAVRKLVGARSLPQWVAYEYEPVRGLVSLGSAEAGSRTGSGSTARRGPYQR